MNDTQSTIVGMKSLDCPGGGWNGMPAEIRERGATVADCLADGSCGCTYGDAVKHIERLTAALQKIIDLDSKRVGGLTIAARIADAALSNEQTVRNA